MSEDRIRLLFADGVKVANIGVEDFAADLAAQHAPVVQVNWTPPPELGEDLQQLLEDIL